MNKSPSVKRSAKLNEVWSMKKKEVLKTELKI